MKLIASIIAASAFIATTATSAIAQEAEAVGKAQSAASTWLALVDSGDYAQSWEQGAAPFQAGISEANWSSTIGSVRAPFGALKSRTVKTADFMRTLPGAPAGEYVVIQYASQFATVANAIETVTPMRGPDGNWRVSGYFIK